MNLGGKEIEIPTLVPTLSREEMSLMTNDIIPNGKQVPRQILQKAIEHATKRMSVGQSPFAD